MGLRGSRTPALTGVTGAPSFLEVMVTSDASIFPETLEAAVELLLIFSSKKEVSSRLEEALELPETEDVDLCVTGSLLLLSAEEAVTVDLVSW